MVTGVARMSRILTGVFTGVLTRMSGILILRLRVLLTLRVEGRVRTDQGKLVEVDLKVLFARKKIWSIRCGQYYWMRLVLGR